MGVTLLRDGDDRVGDHLQFVIKASLRVRNNDPASVSFPGCLHSPVRIDGILRRLVADDGISWSSATFPLCGAVGSRNHVNYAVKQ